MRNLLAFAVLSVASSLSYSALAEKPEAPKEEAGKGGHEEAGGEEAEEKEPEFVAAIDAVFGFGNLPEEGSSAVTTSFLMGGKYSLTPQFALGARWPLTVGGITEAGASKTDLAVGNLEIAGEYAIPVSKHVEVPIELGLALPTASGDAYDTDENKTRRAALNEAAAGARGGENNALFAAHRFGIIPLIGLELGHGNLEASIWTKMEILIKAGGTAAPDPIEQKSVAAESVTGVGLQRWFFDEKFAVSLRAWFSAAIAEEAENPNVVAPSKFQFVLEPGVKGKFGAFRPSLSYIAPIAGALGDRKVGGVRLVLGMAY